MVVPLILALAAPAPLATAQASAVARILPPLELRGRVVMRDGERVSEAGRVERLCDGTTDGRCRLVILDLP